MLLRNGHKATNRTEDGVFSYVSIQQRQLLIQKKCRQSHLAVEVWRAFMRLRILALVLLLCFLAVALASAQTYSVKVERGVEVKMRDGVILRGDIFRPDAEGRFPVLLQRTPYRRATWGYDVDFAQRAASRGYVVFLQDVRGRYTSDGEWYPFLHESEDGYDTIEWIAAQPYSNGKVGMFGGSYVGATQMLAAIAHPPHLAGICPVVTASNYHDGWTYQGGALEQWFDQSWTCGLAQDTLARQIVHMGDPPEDVNVLPLAKYPVFGVDPASVINVSSRGIAPYYLDWLAHPSYDDYWRRWSIEEHYGDIGVPALHIAAWYDIFLGGSLRNYLGLKAGAATEEARKGQRLVVEIGGHSGDGRKIGSRTLALKPRNRQEKRRAETPLRCAGTTIFLREYKTISPPASR